MNQTHKHAADKASLLDDLHLGSILFLTVLFWIGFVARVVLSPLMPTIERDLGLSHTDSGSLFLLISVGYFAGILGAGFLSSLLMHRRTIILSTIIVGLSLTGISLSDHIWSIRLWLVVLGFGAGLYLPSGIATITTLVQAKHWGKVLAIHEMAPNLGFITAPLLCEMLLSSVSWRWVLILLGVLSVCSGIAFSLFGRGGRFAGEPPGRRSVKVLVLEPSFWIMVVLFSLGVSGSLGIYTMLPLFLVTDHGYERNVANTFVALSRIPGIALVFMAGWAQDRFGSKRTLGLVFLLGGMITLFLGLSSGSLLVAMIFFQPWVAGCFFPAGFAALSSIGPPEIRSVSVSVTLPLSMLLGAGAAPTWIGFMGDKGSFGQGIAVVGGCIFCGAVISQFLRFWKEPSASIP
ncbi:MAG: MFS transporter [Desulfobacteraceae bacterium]|nr:MAG: MFS transporter [Desulfobacteraceae bacterium]